MRFIYAIIFRKQHYQLLFLGVVLLVCHSAAFAQIPDNQCTGTNIFAGDFTLSEGAGCVPMKISVFNNTKGNNEIKYIFDYKGGNPYASIYKPTLDSSYLFSKTGTYMVMQISKKDGAELRACRLVTVQDTTPPVFKVQICSGGNITLTIPKDVANGYDDYGIDWGDGKVEIVAKQAPITITHKYLDEDTKRISIQGIHRLGKCGGRSAKAIMPVVSQEAVAITKLTVTGPTTAEIVVKNPGEIPLVLYRQDGGGGFKDIGKKLSLQNETTKVLIDTNTINCFKLKPADTCAANLESNVLCAAYIKAVNDIDKNIVSITPYIGAITKQSIIKNEVVWKNPSRTELVAEDTNPACGQPTCYRLQIDTQQGTVLSNISCVSPLIALCNQLGNVYVPDAFSPNDDGINDTFELHGDLPSDYKLTVFDRWGRAVFQSNNKLNIWNGKENGLPSPTGTYIYYLTMKDNKTGLSFEKRGALVLIR